MVVMEGLAALSFGVEGFVMGITVFAGRKLCVGVDAGQPNPRGMRGFGLSS